MLNYKRYKRNPVVDYPEREWPNKEIEKAPIWCSVDLRDGNQALIEPMVVEEKMEFFNMPVSYTHLQILETYQQGGVSIVCAFDEKPLEHGPFAGVQGVGEFGYPYFRNRCFVLACAGTDAEKVAELKKLYDDILADEEVAAWLQDTMLLEVDTMTEDQVKEHIENVKSIVNEYKDIVTG